MTSAPGLGLAKPRLWVSCGSGTAAGTGSKGVARVKQTVPKLGGGGSAGFQGQARPIGIRPTTATNTQTLLQKQHLPRGGKGSPLSEKPRGLRTLSTGSATETLLRPPFSAGSTSGALRFSVPDLTRAPSLSSLKPHQLHSRSLFGWFSATKEKPRGSGLG